jgi:DNA polymerase V
LVETGQEIKTKVERYTGIPVAVGFGHTRTQAKLANRWAKKHADYQGVFAWNAVDEATLHRLLNNTPAQDIWGIGARIAQRLHQAGIETAWQFMQADPTWVQKTFNITLRKTQQELWGENHLTSEDIEQQTPQQIIASRSFGQPVEDVRSLKEAVSSYMSRAAEKLRKHQLQTKHISVYIRTSPFKMDVPYYGPHISLPLDYPTADNRRLISLGLKLLETIYQAGHQYQKAGVMLSDLSPVDAMQNDLFAPETEEEAKPIMATLDAINQKFGKGKLAVGSAIQTRHWAMKRSRKSPAYTTRWADLHQV